MNQNIVNHKVVDSLNVNKSPFQKLTPNGGGYDTHDKIMKIPNNKMLKERSYSVDMPHRETVRGPLKADHSIHLSQRKHLDNVKVSQVNVLPLKKSTSMSDVSNKINNDEKDNFKRLFDNGFTENGQSVRRRSFELLCSAKLKLNKLGQISSTKQNTKSIHKSYGSSNDVNNVRERISNINFLNQKSMEHDLTSHHNDNPNEVQKADQIRLKRSSSELNVNLRTSNFNSSINDTLGSTSPTQRRHSLPSKKGQVQFGHGLVGLQNLGNTCYMNCVLQCLFKTKLLRDYFSTFKGSNGKLANAFAQLLKDVWSENAPNHIAPSNLKNHIQKYASRFSGTNQQDAQEFLRFLLEGIHEDLNTVKKKTLYPVFDDKHLSDGEKSNVCWDRYLTRESSPVQDMFVGQLKSTLTCSVCQNRSVTYDPFWDLSLPIPKSVLSSIDLIKCFEALTQEETLDGEEKPTCEKCKKNRKSFKGFLIERFPKVLVLHLKRFSGQRFRNKLETKIDFPNILPLREFSADSSDKRLEPVYSLYGVVNHIGGTLGGHYTAFAKHPDTGCWHIYNDAIVGEANVSRVVSPSAYLLFYELTST